MMTEATCSKRRILHIDIETYCDQPLADVGVYRYASDPSFEILLISYAYDNGPVQIIDMSTDERPLDLYMDLSDPDIIKVAHNATFEMICFRAAGIDIDPDQWLCTMWMANYCGLPASLDACASVLNLPQQKMAAGKSLVYFFSKPCKATRANGQRTRNLPIHDPERWEVFKMYNLQDVRTEQSIYSRLKSRCPGIPSREHDIFVLDQIINTRGILIDDVMARNATAMSQEMTDSMMDELRSITGLSNPASVPQFKQYLQRQDIHVDKLTKDVVEELLKTIDDPQIRRALPLKIQVSKAAVKKYEAMLRSEGEDHRVRGMFQYYGANRTGRWAGRLVQLQNLRQNHLSDLDLMRSCVIEKDIDGIRSFYDDVPEVLGQLVRTCFIPSTGRFIVADYSAIEARLLSWLAGEQWRIEVFATHGKIYEASAARMFGVPIESITKTSDLRKKGKIAELALGYGGAVGALERMGAIKMGLKTEELLPIVQNWRKANRNITKLWRSVERCAIDTIRSRYQNNVAIGAGTAEVSRISMNMLESDLVVDLPSGRRLMYKNTELEDTARGPRITYMGTNQTTRKWQKVDTHGGKLVENITQAIARDCLAEAMMRLEDKGYHIVAHVHDEVIIEATEGQALDDVTEIMGASLEWAPGLYLTADGYECPYYKKD